MNNWVGSGITAAEYNRKLAATTHALLRVFQPWGALLTPTGATEGTDQPPKTTD